MHSLTPAVARASNTNTMVSGNAKAYLSSSGAHAQSCAVTFHVPASDTAASARSHTSTATSGSHTFDEDEDGDLDDPLDDDAEHRKMQKRRTLELLNARVARHAATPSDLPILNTTAHAFISVSSICVFSACALSEMNFFERPEKWHQCKFSDFLNLVLTMLFRQFEF